MRNGCIHKVWQLDNQNGSVHVCVCVCVCVYLDTYGY